MLSFNMDTFTDTGESFPSSSCDLNNNECKPSPTPEPAATKEDQTASPTAEDSRCRKSNRLKAKMRKQEVVDQALPTPDKDESYNLRLSSLVKRAQVERRKEAPKKGKGKSKPPPLSKYRRRTANARERMRMKDINEGFEKLRQCLPNMGQEAETKKKEKPTKYTVLSLALNYIRALRDILGYPTLDSVGGEGPSMILDELEGSGELDHYCEDSSKSRTETITEDKDQTFARSSESIVGEGLENASLPCDRVSEALVGEVSASTFPPPCYSSVPGPPCSIIANSLPPSVVSSSGCHTIIRPPGEESFAIPPASSSACTDLLREFSMAGPCVESVFLAKSAASVCRDPLPGQMINFREAASGASPLSSSSSSSSSASVYSLSPSPPSLPLPEDCLDIDHSDLMDVSIAFPGFPEVSDLVGVI